MSVRRDIYLVGFSGSGKTVVGRKLASALNAPFHDTDSLIAQRTRMSIVDIFEKRGEAAFRKLEEKVILELMAARSGRTRVVALGGGALQNRRIRSVVSREGITIYLSCARETLYRRLRDAVDRPMLLSRSGSGKTPVQHLRDRIDSLLRRRIRNYRQADITVATTRRTPTQVVREIRRKLGRYNG